MPDLPDAPDMTDPITNRIRSAPQQAPIQPHPAAAQPPHPLLPGVVAGFGTAVAMWTLWWITHLPAWGQAAPPWHISLPLLALTLFAGSAIGAAAAPRPVLTGTLAGLTTALLSLTVLGAVLSDTQGDSASAEAARQLRADAAAIFTGFMVAAGLTGALGGGAANLARAAGLTPAAPLPGSRGWLARLAVITAIAFVPLIAIGGAVTSTASGMAVADPVVSFVMPLSLMAEPRVFIEHTHRLVGTLVGLTAIALFVATLLIHRGKTAVLMTGGLLALVTAQGLLGIFRVGENSAPLAMVHGMFAQLVFALGIATAVALQPAFARRSDTAPTEPARTKPELSEPEHGITPDDRAIRIGRIAAIAGIAFYALQLATGAASRHLGSVHATYTHVVFAVVVASTVGVAGAALASLDTPSPDSRRLVRIGKGLVAAVILQFMLGVVTLLVVGGGQRREIPTEQQLATAWLGHVERDRALARIQAEEQTALL